MNEGAVAKNSFPHSRRVRRGESEVLLHSEVLPHHSNMANRAVKKSAAAPSFQTSNRPGKQTIDRTPQSRNTKQKLKLKEETSTRIVFIRSTIPNQEEKSNFFFLSLPLLVLDSLPAIWSSLPSRRLDHSPVCLLWHVFASSPVLPGETGLSSRSR